MRQSSLDLPHWVIDGPHGAPKGLWVPPPKNLLGPSDKALVAAWNRWMTDTLNQIVPVLHFSMCQSQSVPWFPDRVSEAIPEVTLEKDKVNPTKHRPTLWQQSAFADSCPVALLRVTCTLFGRLGHRQSFTISYHLWYWVPWQETQEKAKSFGFAWIICSTFSSLMPFRTIAISLIN